MTKKRLALITVFLILIGLIWYFDLFHYISLERIDDWTGWIKSFGLLGPFLYILLYIIATLFFLPGLPLTLLAGLVFGPILGTLYVSIGSTTGALAACITGRYIGRDFVVTKFAKSSLFNRLDQGVKDQGWRMVAITRLVPLFPYNAQNYLYGLTDIPLLTYGFVSWICMLPATAAYVFLAGSIIGGDGNVTKTIAYIGSGIGLLILVSLLSKYLMRSNSLKKED